MIGERFGPVAIVVILFIFGVLMAMEILGKLFPSDVMTGTTWPDQGQIGVAEDRATTDEPGQVKKREQGENEAKNTPQRALRRTDSSGPSTTASSRGDRSRRLGTSTSAFSETSPAFSSAPSSGDSTSGGSTGDPTGGGGGGSSGSTGGGGGSGGVGGVVEDTVDTVGDTVDNTTGAVEDTVDQPTGEVL
jgi:uncharacterized membrane protein YgcG